MPALAPAVIGATGHALVDGLPLDHVSVRDRGLQFGDGVFETIAVVAGRPRLWQRHWQRLAAGCRRLLLPLPERGLLEAEVGQLCAGVEAAVLKIVVTRGDGTQGYGVPTPAVPRRILRLAPWPDPPAEWAQAGVVVRICRTRLGTNPALAGIKHLNRLEQVLARAEWSDPQIAEGLMLDHQGWVVEGVAANLFLVRAGCLVTPRLDEAGVAGVLRGWVLDQGATLPLPVEQRAVALDEVFQAQEVFMTNALIGVRPVRRIEDRDLPVGPVTRLLQAHLAAAFQAEAEHA